MLPDRINPTCLEKRMEIQPYLREESRVATSKQGSTNETKRGVKRKKALDIGKNVPPGASTGFVSAADLVKPRKRQKTLVASEDEAEEGSLRRTVSTSSAAPRKAKTTLKRSAKSIPVQKSKKAKSMKPFLSPPSSIGSDDLDMRKGVRFFSRRSADPPNLDKDEVISLSSSDDDRQEPSSHQDAPASTAWLLEEDDEPALNNIMRPVSDKFERPASVDPISVDDVHMLSDHSVESAEGRHPGSSSAPRATTHRKKHVVPIDLSSSPSSPPRRLRKLASPTKSWDQNENLASVTPPLKKKKRRPLLAAQLNPLFDTSAHHSGDEVSEGSSGSDMDPENSQDRSFLKELPETQVPPSYDQSLIYRTSLMTQAPGGLGFLNKPVRRAPFGIQRGAIAQPTMSSSPRRDDDDDHYELGTFVVDDDSEIIYDTSSEL